MTLVHMLTTALRSLNSDGRGILHVPWSSDSHDPSAFSDALERFHRPSPRIPIIVHGTE